MAKTQEIVVVDIVIEDKGLKNKLGDLKIEIAKLKDTNKELQKSFDAALKEGRDAVVKQLSTEIARNEAQLKQLNIEYTRYQKQIETATLSQKAAAGSYEELYRQYEEGQIALKNLAGTLTLNEKGEYQLSDAYKTAAAELKKKKDALDTFNKGIGDNRSLVGSYSDAIKEAFGEGGAFANQLGALGPAFRVAGQGSELLKGGIKGIGAAVQANPLGLILQSFQLFQELIKRNNTLTEAFQVIMGTLGAVVNGITSVFFKLGGVIFDAFSKPTELLEGFVNYIQGTVVQYVKGLGNIIKGVFTLDFDSVEQGVNQVGGAFKNAVKPVGDAAQATAEYAAKLVEWAARQADVVQRQDELQDREREYKATLTATKLEVNDLIKQARERTEDEQQRLNLLTRAAELEKKNLAEEEAIAKERLDIIKEENAILDEQGQLKDEQRQKQADAETEYVRIVGESAIKQQEIENRKAQLIIQINKDLISQKKGLLESELALLESQGKSTTNKQREIAEQSYKLALEDAQGNQEKIKAAENNYQAELNNIRKAAGDKYKAAAEERNAKQLELAEELADAELLLIQDTTQRQIAEIVLDGQRRLDAIKATGEQRKIIEQAIAFDVADALSKVNEQIAAEELAKTNDTITKTQDARRQALLDRVQEEENLLKLGVATGQITEQQAAQARLELRKQTIQDDFNLILQGELAKQFALESSYTKQQELLQEQYEQGKIEKEAFDAETLELEKAAVDARLVLKTESDAALAAAELQYQTDITQIQVDANAQRIADEKKAADDLKTIQDTKLKALQNGLAAISQLLALDEESAKKNAKARKAIAIAEVGINAYKEISSYWVGAGKDAEKSAVVGGALGTAAAIALTAAAVARSIAAISKITSTGNFAIGGYTGNGQFPADNTGFRVAGVVHAGEYVVPNWMMRSPQIAPIVSSLEGIRKSGRILPFADGGFTSAFKLSQSVKGFDEESIVNAFDGALKKVTIVASATEITDTQTITANIEQGATI